MNDEIAVTLEVASILEAAGIGYMLTGSVALNTYATPRMTRDIDFVGEIFLKDALRIAELFPPDRYYVAVEAAKEAVLHQSSFNLIHLSTFIKIDIMVRKREDYRLTEFARRQQTILDDQPVWVVSKEDLILSKLHWARDNSSTRQLNDVRNLLATGYDQDYVQQWVQKLNLTAMLTQALASQTPPPR